MKRRSTACSSFHQTTFPRRALLRAGGMGLLGMTMPKILQARALEESRKVAPKAKNVIFLFQFGGPSHVDMFDMKPDAPSEYRSPHGQRRTSCPDIEINERLPELARLMDEVTVIRSVHHKMKNHNSAAYYALSGHAPAYVTPSISTRLMEAWSITWLQAETPHCPRLYRILII
jgi:hypothetical protein